MGENATGTLWSAMSSFQAVDFSNPVLAVWNIMLAAKDFMVAIFKMLIWDYAFLEGTWAVVKYALFWPISLALIFSIIMAIRGTSSG